MVHFDWRSVNFFVWNLLLRVSSGSVFGKFDLGRFVLECYLRLVLGLVESKALTAAA